jgi:hypothetical protein
MRTEHWVVVVVVVVAAAVDESTDGTERPTRLERSPPFPDDTEHGGGTASRQEGCVAALAFVGFQVAGSVVVVVVAVAAAVVVVVVVVVVAVVVVAAADGGSAAAGSAADAPVAA